MEGGPRTPGIPPVDGAAAGLKPETRPALGRRTTGSTHDNSTDFDCLGALARDMLLQNEGEFAGTIEFAKS
jgi:hypothetical protein